MKRALLMMLATALALASPSADAMPDWSFDTLPPSGDVAGEPGATVGWGYTIDNPDPVNWLSLSGLNADAFLHGTPLSLFDFPSVAPLATVSVPYDGVNGLYQLVWDPAAPIGFVNSGSFVLSADWYDGDPLAGGNFLEAAPDRSAPYSATVVPEPLIGLLLASGLGGLGLCRRRIGRQ